MALNTILRATPNTILEDQSKIIVAYVMAFGQIPNIKETPHGLMISDAGHFLVTTYENGTFLVDVSMEPNECVWIAKALHRLCKILGGGKVMCSTEHDELSPLVEMEDIQALEDCDEVFDLAFEDFEKFLDRPYDDKGFLKENHWTEEFAFKFYEILLAIDDWYYENINLQNVIKYYVSKTNMENFCLFALKEGAKDLSEIVENIKDYNESYLSYLARYDEDIFAAMKKGLKCLIDVNKMVAKKNTKNVA